MLLGVYADGIKQIVQFGFTFFVYGNTSLLWFLRPTKSGPSFVLYNIIGWVLE
jgi:hypothetical protein